MTSTTATSTLGSRDRAVPETAARGEPRTVVTRMIFRAPAEHVWRVLMLYEQVETRPPLFLRLVLPIPIRTEGGKAAVGDEVRCLYEGGHLVKRIVSIDERHLYAFDVVEQALTVGGGLRLRGGWYALRALPDGRTEVEAGTRYVSPRRPRWIFRRVEAAICHRFHRYLLGAMQRSVRAGVTRPATT